MGIAVSAMMDTAAALLNDTAKVIYTYAAQLPFYNLAQNELQEEMERNNVQSSNAIASPITVAAGVVTIDFSTTPALPSTLIEIQEISERPAGQTVDYIPMTRKEFLPTIVNQIDSLVYWSWINQQLKFIGATIDVQILLYYISSRLPKVTDTSTTISLINAESFLEYRTAALCAWFIGENESRYQVLNQEAENAKDRFLGIDSKGRQGIATRRRPFMASYRNRGGIG